MKIGVVGYGSIGQRHVANLRTLGYDPVIYDPTYGNGVRFERYVYETCDAVVIATPTNVHWGCIRAAAERGCHMLIEKPMATGDVFGLQASLDLAASKAKTVMMGCNHRFHPCIQKAKELLMTGVVGEPEPLWAHFTCAALSIKAPYLSDGVTLIAGGHEVDFALYLLGPAKVVSANAHIHPGYHQDDMVDFVLQHDNGCQSSFHLDFVTRNQIREFRIVGDEGDIDCNLLTRTVVSRFTNYSEDKIVTSQFIGTGSYDDDYLAEITGFIHRIGGGQGPGATGTDGLETLKILLDIRHMAGLG